MLMHRVESVRRMTDIASTIGARRFVNLAWYRLLDPLVVLRTRHRFADVAATMLWVEHAVPDLDTRVSVVMCTRNRAHLLGGAIESVQRQWHRNWELVVVDDGSTDDTPRLLADLDDERVRSVRTSGLGLARARNVALAEVRGEIVTYLDDDNRLHPGWLKSVAWAFDRFDVDLAYGARVMESREAVGGCAATQFPGLHFPPYDARRQRFANAVDVGALAHRAALPLRFDGSLRTHEDWDFFQRASRLATPMRLPAIACFYATSPPDRLSSAPTYNQTSNVVADRNRGSSRVLDIR